MMKKLFENWRKHLNEEPSNLDSLALFTMDEEMGMKRPHLFLYDYKKLMQILDKDGGHLMSEYEHLYREGVPIAMVILADSEDMGHGECWGAFEVVRSAVHKEYQGTGIGKLIYELAMATAWETSQSPVTSDRSSVSNSALRVWKSLGKSTDATEPFDDITDPKTPPPEDDCKFASKGSGVTVADRAYKLDDATRSKRLSQIKEMEAKHEQTMDFITNSLGYSKGVIRNKFKTFMYTLFSKVH